MGSKKLCYDQNLKQMAAISNSVLLEQLKTAASKLADNSNVDAAAAMQLALKHVAENSVEKTKTKHTRKQKEVAGCDRCMARIWGLTGEGSQCKKSRQGDTEYCTMHGKQAAQTTKPLQFDESGKKFGLHLGRFDEPKPWRAESGEVCYAEFAPEGAVDALRKTGEFKWHPYVKQGRDGAKTKKPSTKKEKKEKKEKKAKKTKQSKRSKNAYMFYLDEVRADVRELLEQENAQDGGDSKVTAADVAKKVGEMWNDIKDTDAASTYKQKAAEAKAAVMESIEESQSQTDDSPAVEVTKEEVDDEHVTVSVSEVTLNATPAAVVKMQESPKMPVKLKVSKQPKQPTPPPTPSPSPSDDGLATEVEEIEYNDEIYLKDPTTGLLYNEDGEEVGVMNEDGEVTLNSE